VNGNFSAVIPAGGSGTRLWPVSRARRPKFLLPLPGPRTMLQETVARLAPLCDPARLYVITGAAHAAEVCRQLPALDPDHVVVEPLARGSGPAIGLGTALALRVDPEAIVGSFAADHVVTEPAVFEQTVRAAIEVARRGYLVTIGIRPSYAETGYGYICSGTQIGVFQQLEASEVEQFKEKPEYATASAYVASGRYLWNASMFVWQASTLLAEMRRLLPDLADALETIVAAWDTPRRDAVLADIWPHIADVTIDQGILERSDRVAVVPGRFGWTDLGDWHGFGKVVGDDERANLSVNAEVLALDATGAVVYGNKRLVALLGVENLVVVDTDDALLICDRSRAQEVRRLVDELKRRGSTELV
jgi:mannose-1-phosphate guanylyltransferase